MICLRVRRFSPRAEKLVLRTFRCTSDCTSWINFSPGPPSRNCLLNHSLALALGQFRDKREASFDAIRSFWHRPRWLSISFSLALHAADKLGGLGWPLHSLCNKSARISSAQSSSLSRDEFQCDFGLGFVGQRLGAVVRRAYGRPVGRRRTGRCQFRVAWPGATGSPDPRRAVGWLARRCRPRWALTGLVSRSQQNPPA